MSLGLKLSIEKTVIMASNPITLWQIEGGEVEAVQILFSWVPKSSVDNDCSHEIKRCLFLGRKAMRNLDSALKSRDIPLPTKVHIVKAMVCSFVMYEYASWTIKKAECQRIDAFESGAGEDS